MNPFFLIFSASHLLLLILMELPALVIYVLTLLIILVLFSLENAAQIGVEG